MKSLFLRILPVLVIMSMVLVSCSAPVVLAEPVTTSTPIVMPAASATSAATATSIAPQSDDVWDRIVAKKKIVVGTSWDYPPFASIDPNLHAVGFDMALIGEIGRRLNIPVEIQNFTFEGLPDALQINQIDLAVAAISVTPERASRMSFSPVYYVNQTAILAKNGSSVTTITDFKQLAGLRVGVQRGTTYESMVQRLLVDTRLMSKDKVLSYMQSDEAIRDLIANRVDVVVLGSATASYYNARQELHIVGKGFEEQNLAVAMRLGTPRLNAEIERVMNDMLTDGTILGFIQQYMQSDAIRVSPTPVPTNQPTATPLPPVLTATPPVCVNGMQFVADVTYDDNNMKNPPFVKPGEGFVKTWRVENTGTCTWTPNYRLVYAYGNVDAAQMSGQPLNIPVNVAPGQTVDLSVTLIAPQEPLTYLGFWQIETDKGGRFGQTIWVAITTQSDQNTPVATWEPNSCVVTMTTPTDSIKVNANFDAVWTVKNISGKDWPVDSVDYKFISGTKMQEKDLYDFTQTIKNGESGKIIVDMNAPGTPGIYSTQWAIVSSSTTLCILNITVTVVAK
jgi:polar amino acid transport system substrate-binding protein